MIGPCRIAASRLLAAALLTIGVTLGFALSAAPAAAQDAPQETPWYMPQPWMHPPATGPSVRFPPGYYGNSAGYMSRPYGSFSTYCYGNCRRIRGTVSTGYGVVLFHPTVVAFDQRAYVIVPRSYFQPRYVVVRASAPRAFAPPKPVAVAARRPAQKPLPQFSLQNGVRIIRPLPMVAE
jgi:hypothetical protein